MKEKQYIFWHPATLFIFLYLFFMLFVLDYPYSLENYKTSFPIILAALLLFANIKLEIEIDARQFKYRFFPFQWKYRILNLDDITHYHIKNYTILTYGGLGQRLNFEGTAYIISGKKAFTLFLKNGKFMVFSIKNVEAVKALLGKDKFRFEPEN